MASDDQQNSDSSGQSGDNAQQTQIQPQPTVQTNRPEQPEVSEDDIRWIRKGGGGGNETK